LLELSTNSIEDRLGQKWYYVDKITLALIEDCYA